MTDLPGKDTIEAIENRIGKWPVSVALWVLVLAAVFTAGGVIIKTLQDSFSGLRPFLPQVALNEGAFRVATIFVYLLLGVAAWVATRRFQKLAREVEQAFEREGVALDAIVNSENKIEALEQTIKSLDKRIGYVEKKIGDELRDVLTQRLIAEADKQYHQKQDIEGPPEPPNPKVELGRKLLREAAEQLRDAFKDPVSWDTKATASRGWLALQVSKLATEIFSPDALQDLEAFETTREAKRKLRNQSSDAKEHAMKLANYLEGVAETLTDFDLDSDIDLPASFEQFRKTHGG
jgi:hypothetical protein